MAEILNILIKYANKLENLNEVDAFQKNTNYPHQPWPSHEHRAAELSRKSNKGNLIQEIHYKGELQSETAGVRQPWD